MNDKISPATVTNDDLEPQLEAAVWAVLSQPINADAVERVKSQAFTLGSKPSESVRSSSRTLFSHRRWIQLATVAASILVIIGASMMLPSTPSAFAQAIERLKSAGAFRYKELVYTNVQEAPIEVEVLVADDGRERRSMLDQVVIHDSSGQVRLSLMESNKTATVHQRIVDSQNDSQRQIKWLEQLKSFGKSPDKQLGTKEIDGRSCLGFEVKLAQAVYSIWVDSKTTDLVQVELAGMPKGSAVTKSVMTDFEFNLSLDPTLFSFDVPKGYEGTATTQSPELLPFEESLIVALKGYTEASGGKFPKSIADWGEWAVLLSESGFSKEKMTLVSTRLGTLLPYLTGMSKDDYDYCGGGRSLDEQRAIVFWYRNTDKQLRAIFNDLTISSVTEEDLNRILNRK